MRHFTAFACTTGLPQRARDLTDILTVWQPMNPGTIALDRRLQQKPILTNTEIAQLAHLQRPARPQSPALTLSCSGLSGAEHPTPLTRSSKPSRLHAGEKFGIAKLAEKANEETDFKRTALKSPNIPSHQDNRQHPCCRSVMFSRLTRKRSFDKAFFRARPLAVNRPKEEGDLSFAKCLYFVSIRSTKTSRRIFLISSQFAFSRPSYS